MIQGKLLLLQSHKLSFQDVFLCDIETRGAFKDQTSFDEALLPLADLVKFKCNGMMVSIVENCLLFSDPNTFSFKLFTIKCHRKLINDIAQRASSHL